MDLIIAGTTKLGEYLAINYSQFGLRHRLIGFVDEVSVRRGTSFAGLPVLGTYDSILEMDQVALVLGLESPSEKLDLVRSLLYHPLVSFPNLISKEAWVSPECIFGKGNLILAGSLINFGTQFGNFNTIGQNSSIGHEAIVGNYCSLGQSVQVGGYAYLEDSGLIRDEATISQGIRVGHDSEVAHGAQVDMDVPARSRINGKT